jgi:hypothetical protein
MRSRRRRSAGIVRAAAIGMSAAVVAVGGATPVAAQGGAGAQPAPDTPTLTIRGILSGTMFVQDALFGLGNGQQSLYVVQELDEIWHGADVRSMRLGLDLAGPQVMPGWRVNATVEGDFFGPFAATGNFGDEQPTPRLRLAFADLTNGRTTLRVGQDWSLTLGNIPVSTSHVGFILGWSGGGVIGWRFPGVWLRHRLTPTGAGTNATVALAVMRGSWVDEPAGDGPSAGEAGSPQLEARVDFDGRTATGGTWGLYAVGHWDRKDLGGLAPGEIAVPDASLESWAVETGARLVTPRLTVHGNVYSGQAMAHQFGQILQFGDIGGWGAWAQAGVNLNPRWSLWLYGGTERPDEDDVRTAGGTRLESLIISPMLRFAAGPYSLGVEWLRSDVDYIVGAGEEGRVGNQYLFSARYDFSMRFAPLAPPAGAAR